MNWIFEHFQIVVLVVIGIGSVIKSILEAQAKRRAEAKEVPATESSEEPFLEPVPRRGPSVPPPIRAADYESVVADETSKALKHQQNLALRLQQIRDTKATTTGGAAATRTRVANKGVAKSAAPALLSIRARLKNPKELKRAFILREVLDAPLGLR